MRGYWVSSHMSCVSSRFMCPSPPVCKWPMLVSHHPEAHQIIRCVNAVQFSVTWKLHEVQVLLGGTVDLTGETLSQALLPQRTVWDLSPCCCCCSPDSHLLLSGSLIRGPKQQRNPPLDCHLLNHETTSGILLQQQKAITLLKTNQLFFILLKGILDFAAVTNPAKLWLISSRDWLFVAWDLKVQAGMLERQPWGHWKQGRLPGLFTHKGSSLTAQALLKDPTILWLWGLALQHGDLRGHKPQNMVLREGEKGWALKRQDYDLCSHPFDSWGILQEHTYTEMATFSEALPICQYFY